MEQEIKHTQQRDPEGHTENIERAKELEDAKISMLKALEDGRVYNALQIKEEFNVPDEFLQSPEFLETVKMGMIFWLERGNLDEVLKIKKEFNVPDEIVMETAKIGLIKMLEDGQVNWALKIKKEFNVPDKIAMETAKIGLIKMLEDGRVNWALKIKEEFNVPDEFLQSPKFLEAVKIGLLKMLENGQVYDALKIKKEFNVPPEILQSSEVMETAKIGLIKMLEDGRVNWALKIKEEFNVPDEFLQSPKFLEAVKMGMIYLFERENLDKVIKIKKEFNVPDKIAMEIAKIGMFKALVHGQVDWALKIKEGFTLPEKIKKTFEKTYSVFGDNLNYTLFTQVEALLNGEIGEEAKNLGVTNTGETGINQLKNKIHEFGHIVLNEHNFETKGLLSSKIKSAFFKSLVRLETSEWGGHTDGEFKTMVQNYVDLRNEINPLGEEYIPSEEIGINKTKKKEGFEYTEQFLSQFEYVLGMIKKGKEYAGKKEGGVNEIIAEFEKTTKAIIKSWQEKLVSYPTLIAKEVDEKEKQKMERAMEYLPRQIEEAEKIDLKSIQNPIELFEKMYKIRNSVLNKKLGELMYYLAFYLKPNYAQKDLEEINTENPTKEDISWVLNITQHIALQETVEPYFSKEYFDPENKLKPKERSKKEKELQKKVRKILNTSALEEEMTKMTDSLSEEQLPMKFIPQRNLLTEFSGHFSDACWASKYESILKKFPNFISVVMLQNPDHPKFEKVAGGSMLIETKSAGNDDLLVIRGLNPLENVINQVSPEDFYNKFIEYLKSIADKQGRKLAIVIDKHSGGSSTNRPVLFEFLNKLKTKLKKVKLASNKDTNFNGYNIVNDCYLVE